MMVQATKEKSSYRLAFDAMQTADARALPAWVLRLRETAMERFESVGFPTTDVEDWKYTNVGAISKGAFAPVATGAGGELNVADVAAYLAPEASSRLVFVNGIYRAEFSSVEDLPPGVVVASFAEAFTGEHESVLRSYLASPSDPEIDGFNALNAAFLREGALVYLPKGAQASSPIQLLFLSATTPQPAAVFPRVLVVAERESAATIIESYASVDESRSFTNAVVEVFVGENARVTHYKVQREGEASFHIATTNAKLERSGVYDLTTITLGAQLSRHGIGVRLAHEGAECWVDGLYLVGTGQHADTHSLIDHSSPHCTSHQLYKGILDGKSRAVFNGKVFVHRDAQQTDAQQSNKNLLLSNEARVDTKPQLEIYADDVKCAHGATVGQLEEEELFYLVSRGLHTDLARNLLTYGFAEELVEKIKIESIKRQLDEAILNRLHARLEV
ncbi:MAG TPA: Fe-S cluster assembly protein SufD [Pyrinomonadaceae bacterium]|nr:Fe-S cluster assembly protein SufD [Pyrinomonadaceae bacterium]